MRVSGATIVTIALLVGACAAEPGAADLELVQDPNLNTAAQVAEAVDSILMIVDSPDGLYGPEREGVYGDIRITNADSDPALELVAAISVSDHLPLIRLEQGGLPAKPLDIRLRGRDASGTITVATGGVRGVSIGDAMSTVLVPFNLLVDYLPPFVTKVTPGDGSSINGCDMPLIVVEFSKPVSLETADIRFDPPATVRSIAIDTERRVIQIAVDGIVGDGMSLSYTMTISGVTDVDGRPLDQIPLDPGPNDFMGSFVLTCGPGTSFPIVLCGESMGGPVGFWCPRGLECVDGTCVPTAGTCGEAPCTTGFVCDPADGMCAIDCRIYGFGEACPPDRPVCNDTSGTCGI